MRTCVCLMVVLLLGACGPQGSDVNSDPVVIVTGEANNDPSSNTPNNVNSDNNPNPNNGPSNNTTMRQSLEQSGSRYKARVLQAPGGAQTFVGWHDNELEVDCGISSEDGKCLPRTIVSIDARDGYSISGTTVRAIYSDPGCANLVGVATNGQGCIDIAAGDYIGVDGNRFTNCQGQSVRRVTDYAKVLGSYDGAAYRWAGDTCEADDGVERYEIGALVPRTSIPGWSDALAD